MLFDYGIDLIGIPEVLLSIIIQARESANISYRMKNGTVDAEAYNEASKKDQGVLGEKSIVESCSCQLSWGLVRLLR